MTKNRRIPIPECTVILTDELRNLYEEFRLPESPEEALENCWALAKAKEFVTFFGPDQESALGISITQCGETIRVRYFDAAGDPEAARAALQALLDGDWGYLTQ